MTQADAASKIPARAAKPGAISVPSFLINKKRLRHLRGSDLKVFLVLCAEQARAGRNKRFSYSVPKLMEATGLCERAVGMALGALEKKGGIDRQKNPGPTGNRYRINYGKAPAAKNMKPAKAASGTKRRPNTGSRKPKKPQPPAASPEIPVTSDQDPRDIEYLESQHPAIAASEVKPHIDAASGEPQKPQAAANEESIPAGGEMLAVYDPADPLGVNSLISQEPAIGAAKTTQRRQRIKRPPKEPLVKLDMPYLIDDPEPAPTPTAEFQHPAIAAPEAKPQRRAASRKPKKPEMPGINLFEGYDEVTGKFVAPEPAPTPAAEMEDQGAGRPEQTEPNQQPTSQEPNPPMPQNPALPSLSQEPPSTPIQAAPAQKAIPSPATAPNTPPAAAKATQSQPPIPQPNATTLPPAAKTPPAANTTQSHSPIPQSNAPTPPATIQELASRITDQRADDTLIQELQKAAHNNLELLHGVLEKMDMEHSRYDPTLPAMFINAVFRRCQER
jgi:hypothetical protein